ncbi:M48 family metalloprotease [Sphingomonas sp.]|jgi:predicted Zn-dependent protease|uniref:M48 family metalloprotease n=1 Tax=Sphingomonas sp. TaxID=28214 RepID=UPI002610C20F|nr:M48 family metalloprotease [Sphingomonas sp.]MDF2494421.1 peptidase Ste24p [Sphingomonas sp.]
MSRLLSVSLALPAATVAVTVPVAAHAQARSISASDKAQGAEANPQLLAEFGGKYDGPQAAYVEQVGKRVAVQSGLSNAQGDFTVALLNSPVENAFAIPGGYVYVTRQLLALMNSEAELASVMGHEVGHVAARHSTGRQRTAGIGSILAGVVGAVAGNSAIGQLAGAGARSAAQLYTLKYGRDQEYAADALGVRYIAAAGYNPYAAADMLEQLGASTSLTARLSGQQTGAPTWASTHPNSRERVMRARQLAQQTGKAAGQMTQDTAFLRRLDGLLYDDDPRQGVVTGQTFVHPVMRLRFTAPVGYRIANGSDAVTVAGTGGQAQFKAAAATSDLPGFVAQQFRSLGANAAPTAQAGRANGLDYAYSTVRASANGQAVDATVLAYRFPSATYFWTIVTPAGRGIGPFTPLIESVAPITAQEAARVRGKKLRIMTVKAGDTIDSLSRQMAYTDAQRDRFVTLNGLDDDATLRPGMLVKVVTEA